jgi:hypothetical protein
MAEARREGQVTHAICQERMATLTRLFEAQLCASDRALKLAAEEYRRRLDELNHAHKRALEEREKTVSRELFDTVSAEDRTRLTGMQKEIGDLRAQVVGVEQRVTTWVAAVTLLVAVLAAWSGFGGG